MFIVEDALHDLVMDVLDDMPTVRTWIWSGDMAGAAPADDRFIDFASWYAAAPDTEPDSILHIEDPCQMTYTSGTESLPKGVIFSNQAFMAQYMGCIVDRKTDMIKTGGENVSTCEVEEAIYLDKRMEEVAVIGVSHPKWVEAVTAVVVPRKGEHIEPDEIITLCREHLAPFKVPKKVILVDALPKTPTGKILKRDMRKRYAELFSKADR